MTDKQAAALQVGKRIAGGRGLSSVLLRRASEVELDWNARQQSRIEATDSLGRTLQVSLPAGSALRGGDVLVCADGSLVRVKAAPQPVLVVTHCPEHGAPADLLRAAYYLGSHHVAVDAQTDRLLVAPDRALAELLRGQHLIVTEASAAFDPQDDAYGAGTHASHAHDHQHDHARDHHHHHGDGHGHAHEHQHDHAHDKPKAAARAIGIPVVGQAAPHVHGPECNHDHDHGHSHGHKKHDH